MDNKEKIKYKQGIENLDKKINYVKKIDIATGQVMAEFNLFQRDKYQKLIEEYENWLEEFELEPEFTQAELDAKKAKEDAYNIVKYKDLRRDEYPPIGDQLDYIYWNGIDAWRADMIKPVKDKYPKPQ